MTTTCCALHPDRAAAVTCARCDRPICTDCMIHAAVGWQCPDCVKAGAKQSRVIRPLADRNHTGSVGSTNPTPVVIALVVANVICFVASGFGKASVITRLGMWPNGVHYLHEYYRLVTSMFLHLDILHIGFNMIALLIVGPAVEVMLGKGRFLALYLLAGLGGSVGSYLIAPASSLSAGASGAIMGVMAAYVVLALRQHRPVVPVVVLIGINLALGFSGNVEWQAHVAGLAVGAVLALAFDHSLQPRDAATRVALAVGFGAVTLAVLAVLVLALTPGHLNLS
ncbi:MAG: rhomboid family intramembrane serine protease [Acidimicrobiales bacterium]